MPGYIAKPPICVLQRGHPLAQGLVGAWPFDVGGGGKHVRDLSGQGDDRTVVSFNTWGGSAFGWAMEFNGVDDYLPAATTTAATIALDQTHVVLIQLYSHRTTQTDPGQHICYFLDGRHLTLEIRGWGNADWKKLMTATNDTGDSDDWHVATDTVDFPVREWQSVATVYNTHETPYLRLYRNGKLVATNSDYSGVLANSSNNRHTIGGVPSFSSAIDGQIADYRVYNRALSAEEIAAIYHDPWEIYRPREMTLRAQYIVAALYRMLRRRAR